MGNLLLRPLRLWVMYLPQLAACYLLGVLGRDVAIVLAARFGWNNSLVADLIMPFAGLCQLGSYVAMFLVIRQAIPALSDQSRRALGSIDLFAGVMVPFLAIYWAWRMFADDWIAFQARAEAYYRMGAVMQASLNNQPVDLDPGAIPVTSIVWGIVIGAFVLRFVLKRLQERLPKWVVFIRAYLDALWVFLVLTVAASNNVGILLNPTAWFKERRIVVWLDTSRAELFAHFKPLEVVWSVFSNALHIAFGGAAVPLIWLAIAGIVYGGGSTATWRGAARRVGGHHGAAVVAKVLPAQELIQKRLSVPESALTKSRELAMSQFGKFRPVADSARTILHGGIVAITLYVLLYLVLAYIDMTGSFYHPQPGPGYLVRWIAWFIGPQPEIFWKVALDVIVALCAALVMSLRICLIASTYAFCLERVEQEAAAAEALAAGPGPVLDYPSDAEFDTAAPH
ncbi:hypothetical protein ACFWE3_18310 [Mycobacteriaceae bacterium NPDC060252]